MTGLEPLTWDECWAHLEAHRVGRVGFDRGRGPRIHPVDYAVRDGTLLVTTSRASELGMFAQMFADGARVAFEIDDVDGEGSERWSVCVGALVDVLDTTQGTPPEVSGAPAGHDELVLSMTPVEVTGRRRLASAG